MRVLLVTGPAASGSARVRLLQYSGEFTAAGHEIREQQWIVRSRRELALRSAQLLQGARWADVVVLQKPTQSPRLLQMIGSRAPTIVDIDDAMWVGSSGERTPASDRKGARLVAAASHSAAVVTGSVWLSEQMRAQVPDARTVVIGSAVDLESYRRARAVKRKAVPPRAVWIGSAGNLRDLHAAFLEGIEPLLVRGELELQVICDRAPDLGSTPFTHSEWSAHTEASLLAQATIGVMPLLDDERARGRCSYKAIQYLAAGVVPIASPVGGATEVVQDGRTGLLAGDAQGWTAGLQRLLDQRDLLQELARKGEQLVSERYDRRVVATQWLALFDEIA